MHIYIYIYICGPIYYTFISIVYIETITRVSSTNLSPSYLKTAIVYGWGWSHFPRGFEREEERERETHRENERENETDTS